MTYHDFAKSYARRKRPAFIRAGQDLFNYLYEVRPDLANIIRGVYDLDTFYRDVNVARCLEWLRENWGESE